MPDKKVKPLIEGREKINFKKNPPPNKTTPPPPKMPHKRRFTVAGMKKKNYRPKKLTFVEWLAKKENLSLKNSRKIVFNLFGSFIKDGGIHGEECTSESFLCELCLLQMWLSEYYKYFKQNN